MKIFSTKDIWVDLSNLPRTTCRNYIDWNSCENMTVPFKYCDEEGSLLLLQYIKEKKKIYVKYLDNEPYLIPTYNLKNGQLGSCIKYIDFKYKIGETIGSHKLLDKRVSKEINGESFKEYFCKCLNCAYTYWKREENITKNCPCCCNLIVQEGINDIPTTAPWMVDYFQGGYDEAKQYTYHSSKKIYPVCPDCGKIKSKPVYIYSIYHNHSIGCECSDSKSYPNKFSYAFLSQLPIEKHELEYQPEWLTPYAYDNYFEYNGKSYVLEMDGGIGHGNRIFGSTDKDMKGKEKDIYKDNLAKKHNIEVIRINCEKSDLKYIKENILQSKLNKIFDLSKINWVECDKFALKNLVKEVCVFWEKNNHPNYDDIKKTFSIKCSNTITSYLKKGTMHGWCHYYKGINDNKRKRSVNVYDTNKNYLGTFFGINELAKKSQEIFGVQFNSVMISQVCKGVYKQHKGYIFEWADEN